MRFSIFSSATVAAIVGFASTLALLIAAANAVGASEAQTASWVTAICLAKVAETGWLSWRYKMPIVTAWSTAGLALIGASTGFSMGAAVGAFVLAGLMLVVTGLFKPLTRLVEQIPTGVSAGMLGGILLPFAVGAAKAANVEPLLILPPVAAFLLIRLKNPPLAVMAVLIGGGLYAGFLGKVSETPHLAAANLEFIRPEFTLSALVGLAVPLYLVTMASQNLPGIAVLKASGYDQPPAGPIISITGFFSTLSALFGASTTNLAAITAAICTGEDAHPDKAKRWLTGPVYAVWYLVFALFGGSVVALFAVLPSELIALVAGLALLAPLTNATSIALSDEKGRFAAMATFAVTASGISYFGIGAAFWGLVTGLVIAALSGIAEKKAKP